MRFSEVFVSVRAKHFRESQEGDTRVSRGKCDF